MTAKPKPCWCLVSDDGSVTRAFEERWQAMIVFGECAAAGVIRRVIKYIPETAPNRRKR